MADGKCKACSFYVPERDTELLRFMAAQSNMSLSMRLLMKAFLASNRHATDIDVSLMDLADLIRSMRVDPELFDDVPRNRRPARSISAIEAEEARAAEEAAAAAYAGQIPAPGRVERSEPGFSGPAAVRQERLAASGEASGYPGSVPGMYQERPGTSFQAPPAADAPREPSGIPAPEPPAPAASWQRHGNAAPAPARQDADDLDPMSMMGEGY